MTGECQSGGGVTFRGMQGGWWMNRRLVGRRRRRGGRAMTRIFNDDLGFQVGRHDKKYNYHDMRHES
jgi:hypothetical protein